jgi:hypothetical protein
MATRKKKVVVRDAEYPYLNNPEHPNLFDNFGYPKDHPEAFYYKRHDVNCKTGKFKCDLYGACNLEDLLDYMENLDQTNRFYYELIPGNANMKPETGIRACKLYFDIDCQYKGTDLYGEVYQAWLDDVSPENWRDCFNELETVIINEFEAQDFVINRNGFLYMSAHGKCRRSFHIIQEQTKFSNIAQMNVFVNQIKEKLTHPLAGHIDMCVYSANRLFRVLWSSKVGEFRPLRVGKWPDEQVPIVFDREIFKCHLITNPDPNNAEIPMSVDAPKKPKQAKLGYGYNGERDSNPETEWIDYVPHQHILELLKLTNMDHSHDKDTEESNYMYRLRLTWAVRREAPDNYENIMRQFFSDCKWAGGKTTWTHLEKCGFGNQYRVEYAPTISFLIKTAEKWQLENNTLANFVN